MARLFLVFCAFLAFPLWARAQDISATFALPDAYGTLAVTWSATPLDLRPDADMLQALILQAEAAPGPWTVALKTGRYLISAFSATEVFELEIDLTAEVAASVIEVPPLALGVAVPFRCDAERCPFKDAETGLEFTLPQGWAAEKPYVADMGEGLQADQVSAVFFEDTEGDGAAVWFLNPPDWIEDDNGPCRDVPLGVICSFDITSGAEAALEVIAPSLRVGP